MTHADELSLKVALAVRAYQAEFGIDATLSMLEELAYTIGEQDERTV